MAFTRGAGPEWGTGGCCRPAALGAGKTVLGWETGEAALGRTFSKVVLMGPYWSGTNAIREEVLWRFNAPVLNPDKLEVCASTGEAVASLCQALADGPVLGRRACVGRKCVPKGYGLLDGPQVRVPAGRWSRGRPYVYMPPAAPAPEGGGGCQTQASDAAPAAPDEAPAAGEGLLWSTEPPVTVSFGPETNGDCAWWKHAVRLQKQGPIDTDDDTLVVLVTKDPFFWLKSMSKHFYEMKVAKGPWQRAGLDPLFSELTHEGRSYGDALELWSTAMRSFLDEELYPSDRCVLLRYEDFLFNFWDVMLHLAAFLPAHGQRLKEPPNVRRSKSHGKDVRGRDEALRFYSLQANRHGEFGEKHLERFWRISPELLQALGYGGPTGAAGAADIDQRRRLNAWVPRLRAGDIVAVCFRGEEVVQTNGEAPKPEDSAHDARGALWRTWARVVEVQPGGESAAIEVLPEVPREWLVHIAEDWSLVAWPADRCRSRAQGLCGQEWTVAREWLDLRLPVPSAAGKALPLTEEGYRDTVSLRSTPQMAEFIARVISDLEVNGARVGRVVDRHKLLGFARWFSGEANVQSLAQIRRELPGKEAERWVTFAPPRPTRQPLAPPETAGAGEQAG